MGRFFLSGDFYLLKKSPHQCSQFAVYDRIFLAIDNMEHVVSTEYDINSYKNVINYML